MRVALKRPFSFGEPELFRPSRSVSYSRARAAPGPAAKLGISGDSLLWPHAELLRHDYVRFRTVQASAEVYMYPS